MSGEQEEQIAQIFGQKLCASFAFLETISQHNFMQPMAVLLCSWPSEKEQTSEWRRKICYFSIYLSPYK